ncbi:MAG: hypothetical protein E6767_09425 [Dysgonomonas sp.]|nr:hypothetical protein [Dysgonomonas sp.]
MGNIELLIEGKLCDLPNPNERGKIFLKKEILNPSSFSVVDVQNSYTIKLPITPTNNEIFGYSNIEEVKGKFKSFRKALLIIDGVKVLDGIFRLVEISNYYVGHLIIPKKKNQEDIFGSMFMNQAGKWLIDFIDLSYITKYNTGTYDIQKYGDISPAIFPLVLYGLLPKYDKDGLYFKSDPDNELVTYKNTIDDDIVFSIEDFPPSVNCLQMLKQVFKNAGYNLGGSAYSDKCLTKLYTSYKNPNEYEMQFGASEMKVSGKWGSYLNGSVLNNYATNFVNNQYYTFAANLFNSNNSLLEIEDKGANIRLTESEGTKTVTFKVPYSGLYKVVLNADVKLRSETYNNNSGISIVSGQFSGGIGFKSELKLVRYQDKASFFSEDYDNSFYLNNQNQTSNTNDSKFPSAGAVNFIDQKQNPDFICGFSWGKLNEAVFSKFYNPVNSSVYNNPMAIKGGKSWDTSINDVMFSAVKSNGYKIYNGSGYDDSELYKVNLDNAPDTLTSQTDNYNASGQIAQIVWLNKGDVLDLINVSPYAYSINSCTNQEINFSLSVTPFRHYKNWLQMDQSGASLPGTSINWNDKSTFNIGSIDLIKFLPSDIKVNDWIDNFCKAFNLKLINTSGNDFELNKRGNDVVSNVSNIIDLDKRGHVSIKSNESLSLPYLIELGFTIDNNEEGYYSSITEYKYDDDGHLTDEKLTNSGYTGGGSYYPGGDTANAISQTSNFSYCWYKQLYDADGNPLFNVPVISDREAWEFDYDYEDFADNRYFDKAQRFWYLNASFDTSINSTPVTIATVKGEYSDTQDNLVLNYENKPTSIMNRYFLILADNENCYTVLNTLLRPEEFKDLNRYLVKYNGDLYNIAKMEGYDPTLIQTGQIYLIRKLSRNKLTKKGS